jgi:BetR domain
MWELELINQMDIKAVLAKNLRFLMGRNPLLGSLPLPEEATAKKGCRVGKSTIDRVLKCQTPFNLDALQSVAKVFGITPSALLHPELEQSPESRPDVDLEIQEAKVVSFGRRSTTEWPLSDDLLRDLRRATPEVRLLIDAAARGTLAALLGSQDSPKTQSG